MADPWWKSELGRFIRQVAESSAEQFGLTVAQDDPERVLDAWQRKGGGFWDAVAEAGSLGVTPWLWYAATRPGPMPSGGPSLKEPQVGAADPLGDPTDTATTAGDSDMSGFKIEVLQALLARGIDITHLSPDQLDILISTLWSTPRIQDLRKLELQQVPGLQDVSVTGAEIQKAIEQELFDPAQSSNAATVQAGLALMEQQNVKLTTDQQEFLVSGAGGSSDIRQIVIQEAMRLGVDPALALAIAQQESGLDPGAIGDGGDSVGLFQLNAYGEGAGMSVAERMDPRRNAQIALAEVAAVAQQHPDWSPGQIAAAAQRPADRAGYASAIDSLYGPIRAGKLPAAGSKGQTLKQLYPEAVSRFRAYYGRDPSTQEIQGLVGLNTEQIEQALRSRASHIHGLNFGAYTDLRSTADKVSNELFGHGVTDGMMSEMAAQEKTSPTAVRFYLTQMDIAGKMDPKTYQSLYQLNQPHMAGIYNQPRNFDPRIALDQYRKMQEQQITDQHIQAATAAAQAEEKSGSRQAAPQ